MRSYLQILLQLFLAPSRGWEDVDVASPDPDEMARRGLFPLAGIAAVASFMALVYHSGYSPLSLLIDAIVRFAAYFAGYYITIFAMTTCRPTVTMQGDEPSDRDIRLFAVCMMGLMAVVGFLRNALPSDFAIVNFLYVYLAIIMWRGEQFLHVRQGRSVVFVILAVLAVIVPPLLIMML